MTNLALRLFGFPHASLDGTPIDVRRRKEFALLIYLAVTQRAHSRDVLADLLWPGYGQTSARASLRRTLSGLNRNLGGDLLSVDREQVALPPQEGLWVDVAAFQRHLAACEQHGHGRKPVCAACLAALQDAVALYDDDFLAGFSLADAPGFEAWQVQTAESLRRQLARALKRLAHGLADAGEYAEALRHARRWLDTDPLHEPAQRMLMRLYAQSGDRAAALRQYEAAVLALAAELDVSPEPETTALYEQIRAGAGRSAEEATSVHAGSGLEAKHNLPAQTTSFIGRAVELEQIARRLADPHCRLLTIVGPGGIGKTRLALQAAQQHAGDFRDGVRYVELSTLGTPHLLAPAILHAVAPDEYGDANAQRRLSEHLSGRQLLLVLDNFEHLLDGAVLLADLLRGVPALKIMVTSRERLNLSEEWLEPLDGLAFPPPEEIAESASFLQQHDATRLFLEAVRRVRPGWQPSPADAATVAALCRTLEGMPLGIELAAAWTRTLPLDEVRAELAHGLSILSTSLRDVPARHRSMHTVFDQSWSLLEPEQRSILRQMSVFRGGCTREAAQAVTGAGLAGLRVLVDSSWLRLCATGRYDVHELVRQYCEEKLETEHERETGEAPAEARDRHCNYYASLTQESDPQTEFDDTATWRSEYPNTGTALVWAAESMHLSAVSRLADALRRTCFALGWLDETYQYLSHAADVLDGRLRELEADPERRLMTIDSLARIRSSQIAIASNLGRFDATREHIDQLDMLAKQMPTGSNRLFSHYRVVFERSIRTWHLGEYKAARKHGYEALSLAQDKDFVYFPGRARISQVVFQAHALAAIAYASFNIGLYDEAEKQWRESIALADEIGEKRDRAEHCAQLARLLVVTGAHKQALELAEAALHGSQECDSLVWIGMAYIAIGDARAALGDTVRSRRYFNQGIEIWKRTRFIRLIDSISLLGRVELVEGHTREAISRFHNAIREMEIHGADDSGYMIAAWLGLGWAMLAEPNGAVAHEWFGRALRSGKCAAWEKMEGIAGLAEVAAQEGRCGDAVELLSLVAAHPFTAYSQGEQAKQSLAALRERVAAGVFAERADAGALREPDATIAELLR